MADEKGSREKRGVTSDDVDTPSFWEKFFDAIVRIEWFLPSLLISAAKNALVWLRKLWSIKKRRWLLGGLPLMYVGCTWDYHLSGLLFHHYYCQPDKIGVFVYEKVELGPEYLLPIPEDRQKYDPRIDPRFVLDEKWMINMDAFEQDYQYKHEWIYVSRLGPIRQVVTSVYRRSNNKLLGHSITARRAYGWFSNTFLSLDARPGEGCPDGQDELGYWYGTMIHDSLIKSVFKLNNKEIEK